MLHAVDQNDLLVFKDLIDNAIVATRRWPETFEFADQRFAEPMRVLSDRSEDRLQGSVAHLLGELLEMAETLGCDLDLVHPATSDVILETDPLALFSVPAWPSKWLHQFIVFEDVAGFFEGVEIVGAQEDERRSSVAGDQDAVVLTLYPIGQFR
jgi:hypothetical protein